MSNLKDLALRAKNRLLYKGLRESYSNANVLYSGMNFFDNKHHKKQKEEEEESTTFKNMISEEILLNIPEEHRQKYLLQCIQKYQEERYNNTSKLRNII